ncbi:hypothetical protein ACFPA8_07845 [Streptomyces ovatisporus]|uniref:Uncharacterized protein n=1 Tax=Streptomyces ovatisporus TaxID=1128682 RepID=A0ABV9A673_9ACTN
MGVFDSIFNGERQASVSKYEPPVAKMTSGMVTAAGPKSLNTWRFQSQDHNTLSKVSELYGGDVRKVKGPNGNEVEHVITTDYDVEGVVDSARDVQAAGILWKNGRPHHKCNFKVYLKGTAEGTVGEECGCGEFNLYELKQRAKAKEGPAPNISVDFTPAQDQEFGKVRFQSYSWDVLKMIDGFTAEITEAGEPVVVSFSKVYRSYDDPDTGELIEKREVALAVTGTLNDEIAS